MQQSDIRLIITGAVVNNKSGNVVVTHCGSVSLYKLDGDKMKNEE